ncbi:MAG: hypothetical protein AAF533_15960 [Acidobacteriota bacterium]
MNELSRRSTLRLAVACALMSMTLSVHAQTRISGDRTRIERPSLGSDHLSRLVLDHAPDRIDLLTQPDLRPQVDQLRSELDLVFGGLAPAGSSRTICDVLDAMPCQVELVAPGSTSSGCLLGFLLGHYEFQGPYGVAGAPSVPLDLNGDGALETIVKVSYHSDFAECKETCTVLDYEGTPAGWTVDICDSDTCNGHCGNSVGDVESAAELEIIGEVLDVCNFMSAPLISGELAEKIAFQHLELTDGSYKVCVSDQQVTLGNPRASVRSNDAIDQLFRIPDTYATGAEAMNTDVWFAFNRVISPISSSTTRSGTGLKRVTLSLR